MGDIKDYRDKELKLYALANIFVIIYVEKIITIEGLLNQNDKFTTLLVTIFNSALFLSILYIFVLLSDSLFSEGMKNIIIYFWGHLPGETVFSRMKEKVKDIRFTQEQVLERYKSIYDNMPNQRDHKYRYENSAWYKIYNRYRDNKMVYVANRDYLVCRDMTSSTVVILVLYFIFSIVLQLVPFKIECVIYLVIMFLVTNVATRTKGERMVNNVIICDLQARNENEG